MNSSSSHPVFSPQFQKGFDAWIDRQQRIREPLQSAFYYCVQAWMNATPVVHANGVPGTTFNYVVQFFKTGERHARLPVALGDIGYTLDEITVLKQEGKTAEDIAREMLARGIAPESDSDDDDDD